VYLANIGNEGVGLLATPNRSADGGKTVKIFATHGDASNQVYKSRTVLRDGGAKSGKLVIKGVLRL
jgi:hypothetical protein